MKDVDGTDCCGADMMGAAGVGASTASVLEAGPGASPRAALHCLGVRPIPFLVAKALLERHHYLHSMPGGTCLALGVFTGERLADALTLGVGPTNAHCLVDGASPDDCLTLTHLQLAELLLAETDNLGARHAVPLLRHRRAPGDEGAAGPGTSARPAPNPEGVEKRRPKAA